MSRLAGVEGERLYALTRNGIGVPRWAVIGSDVFARFAAAGGIDARLVGLLAAAAQSDLDEVADRASALINGVEPGGAERQAVEDAFRYVGPGRVSLRLSCADEDCAAEDLPDEDGAESSFGDQFDSYPDVCGFDDVLSRVKACWASSFSAGSLRRRMRDARRRSGPGEIAVVVQRVVLPRRSGVLFTANPDTGDRSQYVIVSAPVSPRGSRDDGSGAETVILDAASGEVRRAVRGETPCPPAGADGDRDRGGADAPGAEQRVLSFTKADLERLWAAGAAVAGIFGRTHKIEWAVADNQLWTLRSRPLAPARPAPGPRRAVPVGDGSTARLGPARDAVIRAVPPKRSAAAAGRVRFALLDGVRAWRGGEELGLGSPQQRSVLAILLLGKESVVSTDQLMRALWGAHAPRAANGTVRTYICQLRRILGPEADGGAAIHRSAGGYWLTIGPGSLDADVFAAHTTLARAAMRRGDLQLAYDRLRAGLALWGGEALAGTRGPYLERQRERLERMRFHAVEECSALGLQLGNPHFPLTELPVLIAGNPLHERLRALFMLALHQSGRQAEALEVYHEIRAVLNDEVGVEPGPELREAQQRVLAQDRSVIGARG